MSVEESNTGQLRPRIHLLPVGIFVRDSRFQRKHLELRDSETNGKMR